jgi:phenylacetate-coenzyme A ligase PaaK-like adenylate-forming protein
MVLEFWMGVIRFWLSDYLGLLFSCMRMLLENTFDFIAEKGRCLKSLKFKGANLFPVSS